MIIGILGLVNSKKILDFIAQSKAKEIDYEIFSFNDFYDYIKNQPSDILASIVLISDGYYNLRGANN